MNELFKNDNWSIWLIVAMFVYMLCSWFYSLHPKLPCKVIRKNGNPTEDFYYSRVRWHRIKEKGYVYDKIHARWKFLTIRQRAKVRADLKDKKMLEIEL